MPRSLTDCIKSSKFTPSEEKYLTDKFTALKESGLDDVAAGQRAIREFQDENLSTLNNLYAEVGLEGFSPMEVVRPRKQPAPISTVVDENVEDKKADIEKRRGEEIKAVEKIPEDEQIAVATTTLPTAGTINYKDITSLAGIDFGYYLNSPEALNKKAKKIYDALKSGDVLINEKILLGKNNNILDGTHRLMARLAMGQKDFEYALPSENFFTQPFSETITKNINAKYDAELAALETPTPTQQQTSTPIQQEEAAEVTPSIEEQGKELAAKIRQLKSKRDTLQANIFGIPIAIYDGLIETIATAVEKGTELAQAIQDAIASVKTRGFDKAAFTNHVEGFISGKKPRVKTTGEVFKKKKVRVRVPASQQRQQTGDPIDDFTLQFKDNIIIQDVLKTHENRDENYVANPNNYERNQIAMKAMRIEMDRIVTDVISANGLAKSGRYFISKMSDPNIPVWVKNTLMQSIQQNYRGRPDILNNLRVNFDTTMATESYVAFASRKDWLAEPGLTGEQEEDILDSFEEGKDIKKNKQNAQAAHDSNNVPPQVEQDIADRTQEDVAEEKAEVKKQSQKKAAPKKKKPAFDTEIYQSKRKAAENTLLGRNPNMSKQQIIDRIKEIIEKC